MATTISELLVKIGVKVEKADQAAAKIKRVRTAAERMGASAKTATGKVASFAKGLAKGLAVAAAAAGVALAATAVKVFRYVDATTTAIDQTNKMAAALGIGVEEMQRLNFAAERSGVSSSTLQKSITTLNDRVLELSKGTINRATESFGELGVTFEQLEGRSATEQLGIVADALKQIEDPARRSALSATLLGKRAGPELQSLLAEGSEGLAALTASARNVLTQEEADRASEFQDRMTDLQQTVSGLAGQIATDLAPTISAYIEQITNWVDANGELLRQDIAEWLATVADFVQALWAEVSAFSDLLGGLIDLFRSASDESSAFASFLDGLIAVVNAALTPFQNLRTLAGEVANALAELGAISVETADDFNRSIGNMEVASAGLNTVGARARATAEDMAALAQAAREAAILSRAFGPGFQGPASPQLLEMAQKEIDAALDKARANRPRLGGGGGGGGKPKPKDKPKKETQQPTGPPVTFKEILGRFLSGDATALSTDIESLAARTPSTRTVQPTVAIDFFQFNFAQGAFDIKSSDPERAGDEVANALKRAFQKAGSSLDSPVVR